MAEHRDVMATASRSLGIRECRQTLERDSDDVYRTTVTMKDGTTIVAVGRGVQESFGNALLRLRKQRDS